MKTVDKFHATKAESAQFFDVSIKTIDTWLRKGMPYVQKGGPGKAWVIDLRKASQWRNEMAASSAQQWAGHDGMVSALFEDRPDHQNGLRLLTEEAIKNFLFDWFESDNLATIRGLLKAEKGLSKEDTAEFIQILFTLLMGGMADWICADSFNKSLQRSGTNIDELHEKMTRHKVITHPPTDPDDVKFQIPDWIRLKPVEFVKEYWPD